MSITVFAVRPVAKPRMTRSDKWKVRPAVARYRAYKDALKIEAKGWTPPESGLSITFHLPMPKSWSRKKRREMNGQPHKKRPDLDNLHKGFLDALLDEDSRVWDHHIRKRWTSGDGYILIQDMV